MNARAILAQGLLTVAVAVAVTAADHLAFARHRVAVATVDVAAILNDVRARYTREYLDAKATDAQRQEVLGRLDRAGPRIERALAQVEAQCGCVLLVRAAVAGGDVPDMTAAVRKRLGM